MAGTSANGDVGEMDIGDEANGREEGGAGCCCGLGSSAPNIEDERLIRVFVAFLDADEETELLGTASVAFDGFDIRGFLVFLPRVFSSSSLEGYISISIDSRGAFSFCSSTLIRDESCDRFEIVPNDGARLSE